MKTQHTLQNQLQIAAHVEGAGPFTLVISIRNSDQTLFSPACALSVRSELSVENPVAFVPALPPLKEFEYSTILRGTGKIGDVVPASTCVIQVGSADQMCAEKTQIEVPEFVM